MKNTLIAPIVCILLSSLTLCRGQRQPLPATRTAPPKKDSVTVAQRIESYRKVNRILPTQDYYMLVRQLNPELADLNSVPVDYQIKLPLFPVVPKERRKQVRIDYKCGCKVDKALNAALVKDFKEYEVFADQYSWIGIQTDIAGTPSLSPFADSLRTLGKKFKSIDRSINKLNRNTASQLMYGVRSLQKLLKDISTNHSINSNQLWIMRAILNDFNRVMINKNTIVTKSASRYKKRQPSHIASLGNSPVLWQNFRDDWFSDFFFSNTDPLRVNIYVALKGESTDLDHVFVTDTYSISFVAPIGVNDEDAWTKVSGMASPVSNTFPPARFYFKVKDGTKTLKEDTVDLWTLTEKDIRGEYRLLSGRPYRMILILDTK